MVPRLPSPGWIIAVVLVLSAIGGFPAALIIAEGVLGLIAWYVWSVKRRPTRPCFFCNGRGATEGGDPELPVPFLRAPIRKCPVCRNAKVRPRWGTRFIDPVAYQNIRTERNNRPKRNF